MANLYSDEAPSSPENKTSDFKPREYQLELYEHAKKQNSILVLGTGSGKTFISILLIKDLGYEIRRSLKNRKWTVFVVNTVPLVYQQGRAIEQHTAFSVGMFERSRGVDVWTEEEWKEELEKHEVLVIIAQIFLDLILHSQLSLAKINLLILDECHHATGNHPMREIMRKYASQSHELRPRVLGLTACVINKKCKIEDVRKKIKELEKTLFSALVTSADAQAVKKHTTAPKEVVVCFPVSEPTEYAKNIQEQLVGIDIEINEMQDIDDRQKKVLLRKLHNINDIMCHLGDWCGARAVKYEMENFEEAEELEEIPAVRHLKKLLCQRLELIYQYCCQEENISNPLNRVTNKVQKLFGILSACKSDVCGLIFVERRNTAKLLYELLLEASKVQKELSFIRPAYVISANTRSSTDIKLLENELKKQRETLAAFSRGESNFLISTSVLEEGLDVKKCNVVIRFDKSLSYSSYVQSRGRARATPAHYILMTEDHSLIDLMSSVALYREIEVVLTDACNHRKLPTVLETSLHFAEDEHVPPYEPYGPDGPSITFESAIRLINVYCGKLPQDKFTELRQEIVYKTSTENEEGNKIMAGIRLPINARLKDTVYGDWMANKELAKKSAALALCKKLHEMKELNDHLRPAEKSDVSILEGLVEIIPEESIERGMPQPGTKKRRQVYNKEMCKAFSTMSNSFKLYSVIVQSKAFCSGEIVIDSGRKNMSVGLLCKETLRLPPFSLYSPKWNEVIVRIQLIDESLQLDSEIINHIEHFHKVVFETLLDINHTMFDYFPQETSLLILPMKGDLIDTSLLSCIASWESLRLHDAETTPDDMFNFERSLFEDAIIRPLYASMSEPMFYVTEILDHANPQDEFPEADQNYKSYEDYFLSKYGRKISNKDQPLVTAKHLPKDLNNLKKVVRGESGKKARHIPPRFVPELCGVLPIKASLWWQIMLIPSVLHRLNSLCVAEDLRKIMTSLQCSEIDNLDFDWLSKLIKKIVQPSGNNLSVILTNAEPKPIPPFMILNALMLRGANDNFDIERLEVLGDSYLKYAVSEYLFLKFPEDHEGKLSQQRSQLVSNKTLYTLGKAKQIPEKVHCTVLNPNLNGILPGFVLKPEMELKLREIDAPHDMWSRFPNSTKEEFEEEMKKSDDVRGRTSCYNPWTEHELGDKSVADSVEALIGVCLLVGGRETATHFLTNLGIGAINDTSLKTQLPVQSALLSKEEWANEEVHRYYEKYCLDRLEERIHYSFNDKSFIVQVVTHSSFCQNKVTDCYQRLEFLGDAILDYLVTGMVFSAHTDYSPGKLSDLRSYYVKNETLARVCAKHNLQRYLLYLAPKLQASIDKYLYLSQNGLDNEEELYTEDDTMDWQDVEVPKALGDLVEAIIGAVYLDSGKSLQKAWDVVQVLMDDIIKQTLTSIPINCVRKLYEMEPAVKFTKLGIEDNDTKATYELQIPGLPPLVRSGKNYKVAKIVAAKAGLRMLKEKGKERCS